MGRGRRNQNQNQQNSNQNYQGQYQPNNNQWPQGNNNQGQYQPNNNQWPQGNNNQGQYQPNNNQRQQGNNQQGPYVSPNYKGRTPRNDYGNNSYVNNGNQTRGNQQGNASSNHRNNRGGQNNHDTESREYNFEQNRLVETWRKDQHEKKQNEQREAAALFFASQRALVESQSEPPAEVINAITLLRVLFKRRISDQHKEKAKYAVDLLQSYVNQQVKKDDESQQSVSILFSWLVCFGDSSLLSDPKVADKISTAIAYWEAKLGISLSQMEEEELSKPSKKETEPEKLLFETNVHVAELLTNFDRFLKESGLTFARVAGGKVYYTNACAATEQERKKEYRFITPADKPDAFFFEGNKDVFQEDGAAVLRASEHAFIFWLMEKEAAEKKARVKEENQRVLQSVARVHPEARKEFEMFEMGLEAQKARLLHQKMEAELAFEKTQKAAMEELEHSLERQRCAYFGLPSPDVVKPKSQFSVAAQKSATSGSSSDYIDRLFYGLKNPTKPVNPAIPVAVKKKPTGGEMGKKLKTTWPQLQHTPRGLYHVDLYRGQLPQDKGGEGHIERNPDDGTYYYLKLAPMPCKQGCTDCANLSGSLDLDGDCVL